MRPQILFPLFADVTTLNGVGPRVAESLSRAFSFFKPRAAYLNQALPEGGRRIVSGKTEVFNAELQMTQAGDGACA